MVLTHELCGQAAVPSPAAAEVPQIILGGWKQPVSLCVVVMGQLQGAEQVDTGKCWFPWAALPKTKGTSLTDPYLLFSQLLGC